MSTTGPTPLPDTTPTATGHPQAAQEPLLPSRRGRVNWTLLLFAVGVPLPIVLIVALFRGCS